MKNPMEMVGRNVMITGAGQGIGKSAAELFYQLGANLTLLDLNEKTLMETASEFDDDRVLAQAGSVTDTAVLQELVDMAAERFGGVHGLVNNAGVIRTAMIENMTMEQWNTVIEVNLTGVFNCLKIVGGDMLKRARAGDKNPGSIVNISSDAGRKGTMGQINYGSAKSGVLGLTMSAAREWGRYGIRVNSVCYGVVETDMTEVVRSEKFRDKYLSNIPLGRFLTPEEAVNSVCFFVSDAGTFITGQHLSVNGGSHMAG